jgi:hypothetical protein
MAGLLLFFTVILVVTVVRYRQLSQGRDREWEREWKELPRRDQMRIAKAVRGGEAVGPGEERLALGSARFQRRFFAGGWLGGRGAQLLFVVVITLAGVLARSLPLVGFGLVAVAVDVWQSVRTRNAQENLDRAIQRYAQDPS